MVEGLFLDRIDLQAGNVAARHAKLATPIEANAADARAIGLNQAAMPAGQTAQRLTFGMHECGIPSDGVIEKQRLEGRGHGNVPWYPLEL